MPDEGEGQAAPDDRVLEGETGQDFGDEPSQDFESEVKQVGKMYDDGVLIFSREGLQSIAHEVQRCRDESGIHTLAHLAIDGNIVEYPAPQRRDKYGQTKTNEIWPYVWYRSIEEMTELGFIFGDAKMARLSAHISSVYWETDEDEPPGLAPSSPAQDLRRRFDETRSGWEASEHYSQVKKLIASAIKPVTHRLKLVGFACGVIDQYESSAMQHRALAQHVMLTGIRSFLSSLSAPDGPSTPEVQCYVQDPSNTDLSKQVLHASGLTVLDDPMGFLEVDEHSVVVSIAPDVPIKQIVADLGRPAAMIWNEIHEDDARSTDPASSRVKEMLARDYVGVDFPHHEDAANKLVLWVRKDLALL
ncbi:hypothetical protein B0H67DRAFT_550781 [Lasiosphaeris hirsuta]|uniref:SRR1-like domain-containing protein n=1 Tax=Lasiosphaeris hirsuta TaxID=260670 RepID=A0AA40B005_9PEZI|nr:hypothetical protein B0H67DRAFT_550781 [Lasiosphaeris hirsuta]